ncbi:DUF1648 domain-containing protein, partial [Candidatus Woesearchaeota archaeon]|nr:DUF1648 domain-containing protein [Candidatus Woesearchaeota archaeon]
IILRVMGFKKEALPILLILGIFIAALILYDDVPQKMPVHWNVKGEVDSYGPKVIGLFVMPLFILLVYLFLTIVPYIEVYKKNVQEFGIHLFGLKIALMLFMLVIYVAGLLPNFNYGINMNYAIVPALTVLFYYLGYILPFIKRNFFIGIRTPWTLSSEGVWQKTHEIGGTTFKVNAMIILLTLFFSNYFIWIILLPIFANLFFLTVYSYLEFRKETRHRKK